MTRINLIPPKDLADQHLMAEYRELPRIFGVVRQKIEKGQPIIPGERYKMGTGHVIFFYDKLGFLENRLNEIIKECKKRDFNISFDTLDISDIPDEYKKDFKPDRKDIEISSQRIQEKLDQKPDFYKYYSRPYYETSTQK